MVEPKRAAWRKAAVRRSLDDSNLSVSTPATAVVHAASGALSSLLTLFPPNLPPSPPLLLDKRMHMRSGRAAAWPVGAIFLFILPTNLRSLSVGSAPSLCIGGEHRVPPYHALGVRRLGDGWPPPVPPSFHPDHPHGDRGGEGHQAPGHPAVPREALFGFQFSSLCVLCVVLCSTCSRGVHRINGWIWCSLH